MLILIEGLLVMEMNCSNLNIDYCCFLSVQCCRFYWFSLRQTTFFVWNAVLYVRSHVHVWQTVTVHVVSYRSMWVGHLYVHDTINNIANYSFVSSVFALTCRGKLWKPCRFCSGCPSCRFMHFGWRSLYISSGPSPSLSLFHANRLSLSRSVSLLSSLWGGASSPLVLSWDHFLHHQTAAGRTSPHSVSVYFNTLWSVHILVKLVSANTFPSQSEWASLISSGPALMCWW